MSYCRWSCDDFRCDIYAYESDYGYEIHVAGSRIVGDIPHVPFILDVSADEWMAAHQVQHDFLATAQREPITLPHAGEHFCESDLVDFEARLLMLRALGYRFPDYVLEIIADEVRDMLSDALERHWPSLESVPEGKDMFPHLPVSGKADHVDVTDNS